MRSAQYIQFQEPGAAIWYYWTGEIGNALKTQKPKRPTSNFIWTRRESGLAFSFT